MVELTPVKTPSKTATLPITLKPIISFSSRLEEFNEPCTSSSVPALSLACTSGTTVQVPPLANHPADIEKPEVCHTHFQKSGQNLNSETGTKKARNIKSAVLPCRRISKRLSKPETSKILNISSKIPVEIKKVKPIKKAKMNMNWKKSDFSSPAQIEDRILHMVDIDQEFTPFKYFSLFFDEKCFELITEQTLSLIHISEPTRPY